MKKALTIAAILLLSPVPSLCRERAQDRGHRQEWKVARLKITGTQKLKKRNILPALSLNASLFRKKIFSVSALRKDSTTLHRLYRSNGFLRVSVEIDTVVRDSARNRVRIVFSVDEGPRTVIESVSLDGDKSGFEPPLEKKLKAGPGKSLSFSIINGDMERIETWCGDRGYLEALADCKIGLSEDSLKSSLQYTFTTGPCITVGTVRITGPDRVHKRVIGRELKFKPGDTLTRKAIRRSINDLYSTGLFSFVTLAYDSLPPDPAPDSSVRIVAIDAQKRDFFAAEFGLGYYTLGGSYKFWQQFRGSVETSYGNFLGMGIKGLLKGKASFVNQEVEAGLVIPWIFGIPIDWDGRALWGHDDEESINFERTRIELKQRYEFNPLQNTGTHIIHRWENSNTLQSPDPDSVGDKTTHSIGWGLSYDTRNDFIDPQKGLYTTIDIEVAGLSGARGNQFVKAETIFRGYAPVLQSSVLSSALRAGIAMPYGSSRIVPSPDRFYLGGASIMRGFDEKQFGETEIIDNKEVPLGGTAYLAMNLLEFRYPIYRIFGGTLFLDAGTLKNVQSSSIQTTAGAVSLGDLHFNAGAGLRLKTPIIIVRLEAGHQLDKELSDGSSWAWHLSVGNAF
ncbi:MAG: BamA/TamA family outer membrane protein [Chitinivibrionales bacterium]|nr:BamA/TamA family outer membrane protein [Chitinivibrionales bacterium]